MKAHQTRVAFHTAALVVELLGTVFLLLDIIRLNSRLPAEGFNLGDTPRYQHWYYHSYPLGFGLVFFGILLAGVCLWFEHKEIPPAEEFKRLRADFNQLRVNQKTQENV
jgi:hypothetical protein